MRNALEDMEKLSFDSNAAFVYGEIRVALESKGTIIGSHDMFIAAHAKSIEAVLVTNNTKEFQRVDNLKVENWSLEKI